MKTETVKGFKDFILDEASKREEIRKILVDTFEKYGFGPAETPVVEYEEFVKGENADDEAVSDIYRLQDRGGRNLALRYEFTFQLKRLMNNQKLPFRRYSIGPVFRDEPVSGNRLRQFVQCDCDVIGAKINDEAELFAMAKEVLKKLEIDNVIYFNNRNLLNEILIKEGTHEKYRGDIIRIIDKLDKQPESVIRKELAEFGAEKLLNIFKKDESYFEKYEAYDRIKILQKYCKMYKVELKFSPSLARGLSYYNGTIFEIKTAKMKETITAGGAYMFNDAQSFGISFGLFRLATLSNIKSKSPDFLIVSLNEDLQSAKIAQKMRSKGMSCTIFSGKPSKAMSYANAYNVKGVIFVGAEEVKKKKFKVKDMATGKEKTLVLEKKIKRNIVVKRK